MGCGAYVCGSEWMMCCVCGVVCGCVGGVCFLTVLLDVTVFLHNTSNPTEAQDERLGNVTEKKTIEKCDTKVCVVGVVEMCVVCGVRMCVVCVVVSVWWVMSLCTCKHVMIREIKVRKFKYFKHLASPPSAGLMLK